MIDSIIKHKRIIINIILFLILIVITFSFSFFIFPIHTWDEIWNYGFSYNISKDMIIYRDFNVLQTPLSFFLGSVFINIFGDYLYSIHIMYAIIVAIIGLIMFRIIKWKFLIVYPFILWQMTPSYNLFSLFFLFIILYLIFYKKDNDIIIGIIMGLVLLTKQNIGICLFVSSIFFSKNKIKFILSFLIPILFCSIYLIYNNAFYEFIDYCFLGMLDFNEYNKSFQFFYILEILIIVYFIYKFIKSKYKDKESFYILLFQIMCYPICDANHFFIAVVPVLYYIIYKYNINKYLLFTIGFTIIFIFLSFSFSGEIYIDKNDTLMYLRNDKAIKEFDDKIDSINNYIVQSEYKFYIIYYAYYIKLINNEEINKYDFMLNGNMGYNGGERYVNEIDNICNRSNCVFLIDNQLDIYDNEFQFNFNIREHIINNYNKIDSNEYFDVYSNEN